MFQQLNIEKKIEKLSCYLIALMLCLALLWKLNLE